jgi:NAD-dependent SIR2 family protein deacetylase
MDRVRCLSCGQLYARADIAARLEELNPWLAAVNPASLGPDGDVEIANVDEFQVPACSACDGVLKPDIVFFGEFVPREKFIEASALVQKADALIIAGSSLVVNSGIRLLDHATRRRIPVIILNRGVTKGDPRATLQIDAGASETLVGLRNRLLG